jgi:lysophospholipase L1-like esterase
MFGLGDLAWSADVDRAFSNYARVIGELHPMRVIVQSTVLTRDPAVNARLAQLNKRLDEFCQTGACEYVDLNSALSAGGELNKRFTVDGVHLLGPGYAAWRDAIAPLVDGVRADRHGL